jgi:MFS family permease
MPASTQPPTPSERKLESHALRTPRSAAFAGIAFSVLLTISLVTMQLAVGDNPTGTGEWLSDPKRRNTVLFALALMPFAGTAFLWFVGVIRDRVGSREDRFFATLFLGSGLLLIAMLVVAEALAAGLVISLGASSTTLATSDAWTIGRNITRELIAGGIQMMGIFITAASTILLRTSVGPRWLAIAGYVISLVLIVSAFFFPWAALLFPAWVLVLSTDILITDRNRRRATDPHVTSP